MKFKRTVKADGTIERYYKCDVCGYEFAISRKDGEETIIKGDEEMEIYSFFSLRSMNNNHRMPCSCPKCNAIQVLIQENGESSDDRRY